jgi:serine/threonine protein kinase, bacterial
MRANLHTVQLDDVTFSLKEEHDLSWLQQQGRVLKVFAEQDSGNLGFGVEREDGKVFIKYAGARTVHYNGEPDAAVQTLKAAIPVYRQLEHPSLIRLIEHFEVANGYAAVFQWFEGESLYKNLSAVKDKQADLPSIRFRQLPLELRLEALARIYDFHVHVEQMGFVAVDFYDGSIMYDFAANELRICDIDVYQRRPYHNPMGRLWGSSRFMSPEEYILHASIDERTNVFNMGATAFVLLGGGKDRSYDMWEAGKELYDVALRAVQEEREARFAGVSEFVEAWNEAGK